MRKRKLYKREGEKQDIKEKRKARKVNGKLEEEKVNNRSKRGETGQRKEE